MGYTGIGDTVPHPHPRSDKTMAEPSKDTGDMAMAHQIGWLVYTDGDREYQTPYPYTSEVFLKTCQLAGWAYRQVPFVPVGYTGYYIRWGTVVYLLNMDTSSKYGFLGKPVYLLSTN